MDDDLELKNATRRILFPDSADSKIPGDGRSAAEYADRHTRVKITINLDGDVVRQFKERAAKEGRAYQSLINQVLREHLEGSTPQKMAKDVAEILGSDRRFLDNLVLELRDRIEGEER
jgi:uncharacterized protein (DUF4415 family)